MKTIKSTRASTPEPEGPGFFNSKGVSIPKAPPRGLYIEKVKGTRSDAPFDYVVKDVGDDSEDGMGVAFTLDDAVEMIKEIRSMR
jgi:hypothetical protein